MLLGAAGCRDHCRTDDLRHLRHAVSGDIDRLRHHHGQGRPLLGRRALCSSFYIGGSAGCFPHRLCLACHRMERLRRRDYRRPGGHGGDRRPRMGAVADLMQSSQDAARSAGDHPAFSGPMLKLGIVSDGDAAVMSGDEGQLEITWPNTVTLAKFADEMEFDALVPVARWWGSAARTIRRVLGLRPIRGRPDIAASTAWCGVVSTSHVSLNHPIIAAPMRRYRPHLQWPASRSTSCAAGTGPEMEMFDMTASIESRRAA